MPRAHLAPYKAAAAAELEQAAFYRRSLQRGLMARSLAIPAIRECLRMANVLTSGARILGQL